MTSSNPDYFRRLHLWESFIDDLGEFACAWASEDSNNQATAESTEWQARLCLLPRGLQDGPLFFQKIGLVVGGMAHQATAGNTSILEHTLFVLISQCARIVGGLWACVATRGHLNRLVIVSYCHRSKSWIRILGTAQNEFRWSILGSQDQIWCFWLHGLISSSPSAPFFFLV